MRQLASQKPGVGSGLRQRAYLSGNDQDRAALAHLNTLPRDKWNGSIPGAGGRLQSNGAENRQPPARLWKEQEAETLLRQQPPSTRIDLTLADWAEQRGDRGGRENRLHNTVLQREPQNEDAILGLTERSILPRRTTRTRRARYLAKHCPRHRTANRSHQYAAPACRLAQAQLVIMPRQKRPSTPFCAGPKIVRLDGKCAGDARCRPFRGTKWSKPQQALDTQKDTIVSSGITTRPTNNDSFTRLTRNDER